MNEITSEYLRSFNDFEKRLKSAEENAFSDSIELDNTHEDLGKEWDEYNVSYEEYIKDPNHSYISEEDFDAYKKAKLESVAERGNYVDDNQVDRRDEIKALLEEKKDEVKFIKDSLYSNYNYAIFKREKLVNMIKNITDNKAEKTRISLEIDRLNKEISCYEKAINNVELYEKLVGKVNSFYYINNDNDKTFYSMKEYENEFNSLDNSNKELENDIHQIDTLSITVDVKHDENSNSYLVTTKIGKMKFTPKRFSEEEIKDNLQKYVTKCVKQVASTTTYSLYDLKQHESRIIINGNDLGFVSFDEINKRVNQEYNLQSEVITEQEEKQNHENAKPADNSLDDSSKNQGNNTPTPSEKVEHIDGEILPTNPYDTNNPIPADNSLDDSTKNQDNDTPAPEETKLDNVEKENDDDNKTTKITNVYVDYNKENNSLIIKAGNSSEVTFNSSFSLDDKSTADTFDLINKTILTQADDEIELSMSRNGLTDTKKCHKDMFAQEISSYYQEELTNTLNNKITNVNVNYNNEDNTLLVTLYGIGGILHKESIKADKVDDLKTSLESIYNAHKDVMDEEIELGMSSNDSTDTKKCTKDTLTQEIVSYYQDKLFNNSNDNNNDNEKTAKITNVYAEYNEENNTLIIKAGNSSEILVDSNINLSDKEKAKEFLNIMNKVIIEQAEDNVNVNLISKSYQNNLVCSKDKILEKIALFVNMDIVNKNDNIDNNNDNDNSIENNENNNTVDEEQRDKNIHRIQARREANLEKSKKKIILETVAAATLGIASFVPIIGPLATIGGVSLGAAALGNGVLLANDSSWGDKLRRHLSKSKLKKIARKNNLEYVENYETKEAYFVKKDSNEKLTSNDDISKTVQEKLDKAFKNKSRGIANPKTASETANYLLSPVNVDNLASAFDNCGGVVETKPSLFSQVMQQDAPELFPDEIKKDDIEKEQNTSNTQEEVVNELVDQLINEPNEDDIRKEANTSNAQEGKANQLIDQLISEPNELESNTIVPTDDDGALDLESEELINMLNGEEVPSKTL